MKRPDHIICYCGSPATLQSNSILYNGKEYGNGKAYICSRFPDCRGSVGTHPDGKPLGTIPDPETKKLRQRVHELVDPIYKERGHHRAKVYGYLSRIMEMDLGDCHIGNFTKEDCLRAIERIKQEPFQERFKSKQRA